MAFQTKYPEDQLVQLLKSRNTDAFSHLYDSYSAALYGVINRIIDNEETAQDLLQDSFIKIWKNIDSYDASKGRLFTWMLNISRNTAIDMFRLQPGSKNTKIQSLDESVNEVNAQIKISTNVDNIGLKEVVNKMRPEYLALINLAYFKGFTQAEISKELNVPLGTVKTRIRSALSQLREILKTK